jgi:hypothetical protein
MYVLSYLSSLATLNVISLHRLIGITFREPCDISHWVTWLICYLSAARLQGFEADLHLQGQQFNTLLGILYVGYILMQIPSYVC